MLITIPGGVENGAARAPHPVFLADTVFEVRVAAVLRLKIVLVEPYFAQSAKLEVQQRLWPSVGALRRRRRRGWRANDADHHGL
jgi:hypothetical protein